MASFESIVVIGAGKMGGALVDGWIAQGVDPAIIYLVDPAFAGDNRGWAAKGVACFARADDMDIAEPSLLMLAIKPQMMGTVLPGLALLDHEKLTVLSIAAGTTLATLQAAFPKAVCIRTMPNTPAAVGAGITAAYGPDASSQVQSGVTALLEAVGQVVWVDTERAMDAVTAVSGSGPAYVFHMVEALAEAGEMLGLPAETAMALARQTIVGAGKLLARSDETAAALRTNVTSPGGTTAAGLAVLRDTGQLTDLMRATTKAAFDRSVALAASKDVPNS
ncbi:MAG: pyrroline-5-carboxylate reductase [Hyphomicrobiales bacterium]|jgi:pyrroline-5-carboxylate reductase